MASRHALLPLILTSALFLVHCSSGDDDSGTGASGGTTAGSTGTGGSAAGSGGTTSGAGMPGSGGSSITGGTSSGAGQGGAGGSAAGKGGNGGAPGAGHGGMAGGGGSSAGAAGNAGSGAGGASTGGRGASGGSGMSGMGGAVGAGSGGKAGSGAGGSGGSGGFTLTSSVLTEGGMFPDTNTCAGADTSPELTWGAGPSGTMSFAVILLDTSITLNHWVIWDIPASVTSLPAMLDTMAMPSMPAGAKQKSFSGNGYAGPCPNGMDHVYKFTVYALPVATLSGVTTSSQPAQLSTAIMNAGPLASASLSAHSSASQN